MVERFEPTFAVVQIIFSRRKGTMYIEATELETLLEQEDGYIETLKKRWATPLLTPESERALRLGKRTELLGDLQMRKERGEVKPAEESR